MSDNVAKQLQQLPEPNWTDAFNALKSSIFRTMNCVQIGIIESFDADKQTATIRFALKKVIATAPDGTRTLAERPIVLQVPVMVLYGGSSYLTMPIAPGDTCIILFNDQEIDQWFSNGGVQTPVSARAHDVSDAMAIVGVRSLQNSIASYLTNGVRLAYNLTSKIDLTADKIESIAELFKHNGNMEITGDLLVDGDTHIIGDVHIEGGMQVDGLVTGDGGGNFRLGANVDLNGHGLSGGVVNSSNGASGTFGVVTVVNGIVTSGI